MKTLYLMRHAKSSWKEPDLRDYERPLNKRGNRDAPFMGNLLKEKGIRPDIIISSGATRAYTTATIISGQLEYPIKQIIIEDRIYDASAGELIDIINSIEDSNNFAMLFGHNPGFTMLSNYLSDKRIDNIPTSGFVTIQFDLNSWSDVELGSGVLTDFEYPKKYLK